MRCSLAFEFLVLILILANDFFCYFCLSLCTKFRSLIEPTKSTKIIIQWIKMNTQYTCRSNSFKNRKEGLHYQELPMQYVPITTMFDTCLWLYVFDKILCDQDRQVDNFLKEIPVSSINKIENHSIIEILWRIAFNTSNPIINLY